MLAGLQGWAIFSLIIVVLLVLDLAVFNRRAHQVSLKEAIGWSAFWIALGLAFNVAVYYFNGPKQGWQWLAAYIMEKSLSVDNLFVICVIFAYFRVEPKYQHRVLFWGIVGAIVMRAAILLVGVEVLERLEWTAYLFGAFLIYTGIKMVRVDEDDEGVHPDKNILVKLVRRFFPVTGDFRGEHFFLRENGVLHATPLLIVLLVIESADLMFAVDSIPAVLGLVDRDLPAAANYFTVLTSNVFAILGLRALYFVLADVIDRFHYLKLGVCVILVFVGAKMILEQLGYHIAVELSLLVILSVLFMAAICSMWRDRRLRLTGRLEDAVLPIAVTVEEPEDDTEVTVQNPS